MTTPTPTPAEGPAEWDRGGKVDGHRPTDHTSPAPDDPSTRTPPIDVLLPRLERVQERDAGQWYASCPTAAHEHGDRSRGLAVRELPDGRVLVHCFAGCAVEDVVAAIGLELVDLFPANARPSRGVGPPRLPAREALEIIRHETAICACAAEHLLAGTASADDVERVQTAVTRIHRVLGGMR